MYLFFLCWTRQRGGERESELRGANVLLELSIAKFRAVDEMSWAVFGFFRGKCVFTPAPSSAPHTYTRQRKKRYIKFSIQPQRWRRWLLLNNEKSEKFPMKSSHSPDFFLSSPYIFFLEIINNYITPRLLRLEFIYIFLWGQSKCEACWKEEIKIGMIWESCASYFIANKQRWADQLPATSHLVPRDLPTERETHLSLTICQKWFINFPPLLWWISSKATISCDEDVWDDDDEYYYYWSPVTSETVWYVTQHHLNLVCFFGCDSSLLRDTSSPPNFFFLYYNFCVVISYDFLSCSSHSSGPQALNSSLRFVNLITHTACLIASVSPFFLSPISIRR